MSCIDSAWRARRATRADFAGIIKRLRGQLEALLESGPPNLEALLDRATQMGLPC